MEHPFPLRHLVDLGAKKSGGFKNKGVNPSLANVISMQATEFLHCVNCPRNSRRVVVKQVRWERPGEGWLKLNTDGAANDLLNSGGVAL